MAFALSSEFPSRLKMLRFFHLALFVVAFLPSSTEPLTQPPKQPLPPLPPLPPPLAWSRSASPPHALSLTDPTTKRSYSVCHPTTAGPEAASQNIRRACLRRGTPPSNTTVLDCTLGVGSDAHVLLSCGAEVVGVERDARVHALVSDAFERSSRRPTKIYNADARDVIRSMLAGGCGDGNALGVVYIDVMFPKRKKNRAAAKANMEVR